MTGLRSAKIHYVMSSDAWHTNCGRHVTLTLQVTQDPGAVTCATCAREAEAVHQRQQRQPRMCDMVIRGTIRLADGTTRVETMDIGHYMSQETLDALRDAYIAEGDYLAAKGCRCGGEGCGVCDDDTYDPGSPVQRVIDKCLTEEYMPGAGPVELLDVESLTFPGGGTVQRK